MTDRQWVTEPDEYVCPLSVETQVIAKEELREDENLRQTALASMREWIMQNPKIKNCRMDSKFLLRFLRFKKFHVTLAQEALERYVLLRQTFGVAFSCLDIRIPMMEELTDLGYLFPCPKRDSKGRKKTLPMRHKEVHCINAHPSMKFALDFGMLYTNLNEALDSGYLEKDVLPKEYGGVMPMAEMIALWKEELKKSHPILMSHDKMEVNEELFSPKAREGAVSALKGMPYPVDRRAILYAELPEILGN
ncbi:hypothetical protein NQ318_002426 [Aromia moschata]|uniref:CRAL/TRIO N-terminal domain-containing protein n=1 Tax=Aromia moschata TaxID=1265417 RepID=A0AAV8YGB4_9CUCU|nr:hypothetical protein NQ318_002426 [Aromia moschata]